MKLSSLPLIVLLLVATAEKARADAPLVWRWVELDVSSCETTVFKPPLVYAPDEYIRGDSFTSNLVRGSVSQFGFNPYGGSYAHREDGNQDATRGLPPIGKTLQVALAKFDPAFCKSVIGKRVRFNYSYNCDTWPRTGACIAPDQLVEVAPATPNHSIERTSPGKPGAASHVKR